MTKNVRPNGEKTNNKRKRDENQNKPDRPGKKAKTLEPEKNANYVRPVFDGKFNSIQVLGFKKKFVTHLFEADDFHLKQFHFFSS